MSRYEHEALSGIAKNVKRLMLERRISAVELGRRTEIPDSRIEVLLAGNEDPTASDLLRLAAALDVQISEMLAGINWESDGEGSGAFRQESE